MTYKMNIKVVLHNHPTNHEINNKFSHMDDDAIAQLKNISKYTSNTVQLFIMYNEDDKDFVIGYLLLEHADQNSNNQNSFEALFFSVVFIYIVDGYRNKKLSKLFLKPTCEFIRKTTKILISKHGLKKESKINISCEPRIQQSKIFCQKLKDELSNILLGDRLPNFIQEENIPNLMANDEFPAQ